MEEPVLSILICTLPQRIAMFTQLQFELYAQMLPFAEKVELLWDDHPADPTGTKRNRLLERATGKYISFVDDDDMVYPCYVAEIMNASQYDCDCIAINGIYTQDGSGEIKWKLSKDYPNETINELGQQVYLRTMNHIGIVKRGLALMAKFPDIGHGEDKEYSIRLNPWLKTEATIQPPIYHYRYINTPKEYLK